MIKYLRKTLPRGHWGEWLGIDELQWHIKNVFAFMRLNRAIEEKTREEAEKK